MREERRRRPIGDSVPPPEKEKKKQRQLFHSHISTKHSMKKMIKRICIIIPIFLIVFELTILLVFSPLFFIGLTSDPVSYRPFLLLLLPLIILVPMFMISIPLGLIIGYRSVNSIIKDNYVEITKSKVIVTTKLSNRVSPRIVDIPIMDMEDIIPVDERYLQTRRNETGLLFHLLMSYYELKPRLGDYFNLFSKKEDLFRIKLRNPVFVPYFDYIWTASDDYKKGGNVDEIVINMDPDVVDRFMEKVRHLQNEKGGRGGSGT